jgi:O-antigen/teichoic acid export membrane protein
VDVPVSRFKELTTGTAIYGAADVAIQALNFLLLPVYVLYLTRADYGVLALLAAIEAPAKLFFRWGIDGAFMRFWYDVDDEAYRQRLGSTLFYFLLAINGGLLVLAVSAAPQLSRTFLGGSEATLALQLVFLNTFAVGFTFIPFHILRMEKRALTYSLLAFGRSLTTLVLRLVMVVGLGMGVLGVVITDVVVTAALILATLPWFTRLIRPVVSMELLKKSLAFGLPRVPHGFALQVMAVADRFVLEKFRTLAEVGVYSIGVSFGLVPKIALAAFETAWAPFYYATAREADAPAVFSRVATHGIAVLAVMTAGLAAIAADLLELMTRGEFTSAAPVVAWTALGVFFYGIYLLTSIGLNITSHTQYYPVSTTIGAGVNVALNLALVPSFGMLGAAWANAAAYGLQMVVAFGLSQRFYPIRYEPRIAIVLAAAVAAYTAGILLPPMPPLIGVLARGSVVVAIVALVLWRARFFTREERLWLQAVRSKARRHQAAGVPLATAETTEMAGEIVAVDVPETVLPPRKEPGR